MKDLVLAHKTTYTHTRTYIFKHSHTHKHTNVRKIEGKQEDDEEKIVENGIQSANVLNRKIRHTKR